METCSLLGVNWVQVLGLMTEVNRNSVLKVASSPARLRRYSGLV